MYDDVILFFYLFLFDMTVCGSHPDYVHASQVPARLRVSTTRVHQENPRVHIDPDRPDGRHVGGQEYQEYIISFPPLSKLNNNNHMTASGEHMISIHNNIHICNTRFSFA